jgi:hypothetical protein
MAGPAAPREHHVVIVSGLLLVTRGAGFAHFPRRSCVRLMTARAFLMTGRRCRMFASVAIATLLGKTSIVGLVAPAAGRVLLERRCLRLVALLTGLSVTCGVMRKALMASRAIRVSARGVGLPNLLSVTLGTKGRASRHAPHEAMGLMALTTGQVQLAVTPILSRGFVAGSARLRRGTTPPMSIRPMRLVATDAGRSPSTDHRMIRCLTVVTTNARPRGSRLHVVLFVTAGALRMGRHRGRRKGLMPLVAALARARCRRPQIVVGMAGRAGLVPILECRRGRDLRRLQLEPNAPRR